MKANTRILHHNTSLSECNSQDPSGTLTISDLAYAYGASVRGTLSARFAFNGDWLEVSGSIEGPIVRTRSETPALVDGSGRSVIEDDEGGPGSNRRPPECDSTES
jgi:hypothetical protein